METWVTVSKSNITRCMMIEHHRRRMHVSDVCMHMHVFDGMHTPSTMFEHLATLDI